MTAEPYNQCLCKKVPRPSGFEILLKLLQLLGKLLTLINVFVPKTVPPTMILDLYHIYIYYLLLFIKAVNASTLKFIWCGL